MVHFHFITIISLVIFYLYTIMYITGNCYKYHQGNKQKLAYFCNYLNLLFKHIALITYHQKSIIIKDYNFIYSLKYDII